MRFRTVAAYMFAVSFLAVAARPCLASTTYQGGSWFSGSSWSGGTVPTLADDVIIPTGNSITLSSGSAQANTITVQGTSTITIQSASLTVDGGGNNPSSINAAGAITLTHSSSTLFITATQTWTGAGSIELAHSEAAISISSGATWTVAFSEIFGEGEFLGAGTLKLSNNAIVEANLGGTLALASSLSLDDTAGCTWSAESGSALVFNHAATNLDGDIFCNDQASMTFNADVTTTGLFYFGNSPGGADIPTVINVADDVDFTYYDYFGSSCSNPGSGSGPWTISGPTTVSCCVGCE
jgi:hypothetical protein